MTWSQPKPARSVIFIFNTVVCVLYSVPDPQNLIPPQYLLNGVIGTTPRFLLVAIIDGGCSKPKNELRLYLVCARALLVCHCFKNRYVNFYFISIPHSIILSLKRDALFSLSHPWGDRNWLFAPVSLHGLSLPRYLNFLTTYPINPFLSTLYTAPLQIDARNPRVILWQRKSLLKIQFQKREWKNF